MFRCEVVVDAQQPKKGLVKRIINKAKHPKGKHAHDQVRLTDWEKRGGPAAES
jgi:hypothetical protein